MSAIRKYRLPSGPELGFRTLKVPGSRLLDHAALKSHSCKDNWLVKATFFGH
jgi:hypothetical protein